MSLLASTLMTKFEARHGYPPGTNAVFRADSASGQRAAQVLAAAGLSGDLLAFYAQVERVSLPDVGNGLFIHPAKGTVFGSDGGGGLFVLAADEHVYRLAGGTLVSLVPVGSPGVSSGSSLPRRPRPG